MLTELGDATLAELPGRGSVDDVTQGAVSAVLDHPRGISRMGSQPQFRLRMRAGARTSAQLRERGPRPPCIGPERTFELAH
ncbi:hypothetical protein GCM10027068_02920 [Prescottella soli]